MTIKIIKVILWFRMTSKTTIVGLLVFMGAQKTTATSYLEGGGSPS